LAKEGSAVEKERGKRTGKDIRASANRLLCYLAGKGKRKEGNPVLCSPIDTYSRNSLTAGQRGVRDKKMERSGRKLRRNARTGSMKEKPEREKKSGLAETSRKEEGKKRTRSENKDQTADGKTEFLLLLSCSIMKRRQRDNHASTKTRMRTERMREKRIQ
jgi:hypothetical protein